MPPSHNLAVIVHKDCDIASQKEEYVDEKTQVEDDFGKVSIPKAKLKDNRKLTVMKWGWLDTKVINCRGEELNEKPMFRPHLNEHRCVVVVEGAFEWTPDKEPYKYVHRGRDYLFLAGLYNRGGEVILLTVDANEKLGKVHHRMPVMLEENAIDAWIDPSKTFNEVYKLIVDIDHAYSEVDAVKISKLVSHLENKGSDVILAEDELLEKKKKEGKAITSYFTMQKKENKIDKLGDVIKEEEKKPNKHFMASSSSSKENHHKLKTQKTHEDTKSKKSKSRKDSEDEKTSKVHTSKRLA